MERTAQLEPAQFLRVAASVIPKEVALTMTQSVGALDPEDMLILLELLRAAKQALPDIGERKPGDAMELMLAALRAHTAPLVTSSATNGKVLD